MTLMDRRGRRRRFRSEVLWIVLTILGMAWFLSGAEVSFSFEDVMSWASVTDENRMRRLVVLVLCLTAVVVVYRVLTGRDNDRK